MGSGTNWTGAGVGFVAGVLLGGTGGIAGAAGGAQADKSDGVKGALEGAARSEATGGGYAVRNMLDQKGPEAPPDEPVTPQSGDMASTKWNMDLYNRLAATAGGTLTTSPRPWTGQAISNDPNSPRKSLLGS